MSVSPHDSSTSSGLIIPANIPGDDLKPYKLEEVASTLRSAGSSAVTQAEAAEASWAGLSAVLESPQGPTIDSALGTPSTTAGTIRTKFDRVADALDDFAAAIRPIKQTFRDIKTDAEEFRATIRPDERVWVSPRETKEYEGNGLAVVSTTGSYTTSYSTDSSQSEVLSYLRGRGETARAHGGQVQILASWTESSEHIDQNNALMDRLADAYTLLQNAEADCANAINRQRDGMCVADIEYIEAWQLKQSGENTAILPWGNRVDEDRNCGESFWWGVGSAAGEGLEGLGTLIGRDPMSGNFSWETFGQGWLGAVQGIGTLLVITSPPLMLLGRAGVPVLSDAVNMGDEMVKGLLAWDTWSENPAEAAGRVFFNVGSMFIPGAGQVGAALKGLTAGVHVLDAATDASRLTNAVLNGIAKVDGIITKVDGFIGDAAAGLRTTIDDLVPTGWKHTPDLDDLHVGGDRTPERTPHEMGATGSSPGSPPTSQIDTNDVASTSLEESVTGARIGPRDTELREHWAKQTYEDIRASQTDLDQMASHPSSVTMPDGTVLTRSDIAAIKAHLFEDDHRLNEPGEAERWGRFDSDADQAEAWLRLEEGTATDMDRVLMHHEFLELNYLREHPGVTYREAHAIANETANWERLRNGGQTWR